MSSRLFWGFERVEFVSCRFFDGFACFVLHFRDAGPSRQRVEQANLYGLRFAISPEPNPDSRPHSSAIYQSVGRIEEARQLLKNGCVWMFGVQQVRHLVHCWALRMGNRAFAVFLGTGWLGLLSCACCSACDVLNCEPLGLACFCFVVPFSASRPFIRAH